MFRIPVGSRITQTSRFLNAARNPCQDEGFGDFPVAAGSRCALYRRTPCLIYDGVSTPISVDSEPCGIKFMDCAIQPKGLDRPSTRHNALTDDLDGLDR